MMVINYSIKTKDDWDTGAFIPYTDEMNNLIHEIFVSDLEFKDRFGHFDFMVVDVDENGDEIRRHMDTKGILLTPEVKALLEKLKEMEKKNESNN